MKILFINKFLHPNGGSETYIFKLGEHLKSCGHEVEYFGMEHEGGCVGNSAEIYTSDMDFHGGSKLSKLTYPLKTIYSREAYKKLTIVLEQFQPDIIHLNNFNYQLTPSVITAAKAWRKKSGKKCGIVFTAHDYQLLCPNHMFKNPVTGEICEKCLGGRFTNCLKGKCIHSSAARSAIGMAEAYFWKYKNVYSNIDVIICCSEFMKSKMDTNPLFASKTVALRNFVEKAEAEDTQKSDYVLYFGRYAEEKGIRTLLEASKMLPDIKFVFAGSGALEDEINKVKNIENVGFKSGAELEKLIRSAALSVYPSEWYENCPFSVMESLMRATPVIGADIGGIPELIDRGVTGELFESSNARDLADKISALINDKEKLAEMSRNCRNIEFDDVSEYCEKLLAIYGGVVNG